MEALLLQHPKIVDAAVIGVYSEEEVTELPRFVPRAIPKELCLEGVLTFPLLPATQGIRRSQGEATTRSRVRSILHGDTGVGPRPRGQTQVPQGRRGCDRSSSKECGGEDPQKGVARPSQGGILSQTKAVIMRTTQTHKIRCNDWLMTYPIQKKRL